MQTGVYTDHCNYGVLGESFFLCRFICHINKGISSMYRGWWQHEKFEKINELWQRCTWGGKCVAVSSGLCWHRVWRRMMEGGQRWLSTVIKHPSPQISCRLIRRLFVISYAACESDPQDCLRTGRVRIKEGQKLVKSLCWCELLTPTNTFIKQSCDPS